MEPVVEALRLGGASPSALEELALADLLSTGQFDRHLRRLRSLYRTRRDRLIDAIASANPSLHATGIAAGLHLLVEVVDSTTSETDVRARADRYGVGLGYLGPHWHHDGEHPQGFLIGYAKQPAHAFSDALDTLIAILHDPADSS